MSLFHTHAWKEVRRVFTPPYAGKGWFSDEEGFSRLAHGFTTIELQCHVCHDIKTVRAIGNLTVPSSVA